jgi:enoyl-[acyl-carrier protein] reductase II
LLLRSPLCDLLKIDVPIIQTGMSVFTSAELVVAASDACGLGTLVGWRRPVEDLVKQMSAIRELTSKPFGVNHLVPDLDDAGWAAPLAAAPAVISLALGDPGDLIAQAHDVGSLVVHQIATAWQAYEAAERGVDVIIAQGGEAGGYGGQIATMHSCSKRSTRSHLSP